MTELLDVLGDPTRRRIFELLTQRGPLAVTALAQLVPVSRPAVSQHLKVLADARLVRVRSEGTRRIYSADPRALESVGAWLDAQWASVLDHFERAARRTGATMTIDTIPTISKTRTVPLPPEAAFALFTDRMHEWWPTATHSTAGDDVVDIRFESRVGGRVVEVAADGTEHSWADVLAWDPPNRFVLSWHPNPSPVAASRLEVRFVPSGDGTEVLLDHGGWEEFGDRGTELRDGYDAGWEPVLDRLTSAARGLQRR